MTQKKLITLRELADSIGVHSSTVSRVMNPDTRHLISADVVDRVLQAARRLKYSPNRITATLRTKRSGLPGGYVVPRASHRAVTGLACPGRERLMEQPVSSSHQFSCETETQATFSSHGTKLLCAGRPAKSRRWKSVTMKS
ncbi:LacI family DNA-binding transcriptional regulator [Paraburkholderia caledonica]|uniref:LacI family DNA-binding transcriptional regulator n=1 Tax=Paraburkholderia caledonica TaxID=134536 RepID=UPI000A055FBE|nr:LacI family DNA-binding transcriptional regulator [Paraburkholderia caledonica]